MSQTLDVPVDVETRFDEWGVCVNGHLQFVCLQSCPASISDGVVPSEMWTCCDDNVDLDKVVAELALGQVEGQLTSGVILVCGAVGHLSSARAGVPGVVVAHVSPDDLVALVRWLKKSDNRLHWSRPENLTGVVERLCEHVLLFVKEVEKVCLLGDGIAGVVTHDQAVRLSGLEREESRLKQELTAADQRLQACTDQLGARTKDVAALVEAAKRMQTEADRREKVEQTLRGQLAQHETHLLVLKDRHDTNATTFHRMEDALVGSKKALFDAGMVSSNLMVCALLSCCYCLVFAGGRVLCMCLRDVCARVGQGLTGAFM